VIPIHPPAPCINAHVSANVNLRPPAYLGKLILRVARAMRAVLMGIRSDRTDRQTQWKVCGVQDAGPRWGLVVRGGRHHPQRVAQRNKSKFYLKIDHVPRFWNKSELQQSEQKSFSSIPRGSSSQHLGLWPSAYAGTRCRKQTYKKSHRCVQSGSRPVIGLSRQPAMQIKTAATVPDKHPRKMEEPNKQSSENKYAPTIELGKRVAG
jgi:hypothetical protein